MDWPRRIWTRRRFLGATAATSVIAACSGDDSATPDPQPTTAADPDPSPTAVALPGLTTAIEVGELEDIRDGFRDQGLLYIPTARAWLAPFPDEHRDAALETYPSELHAGIEAGLIAMFQKCPHLGCRVDWCAGSALIECPCHGSAYSPTGEWREGPAPRGLDLFPIIVDGTRIAIDGSTVVEGLALSVDVTGAQPIGPRCIDSG